MNKKIHSNQISIISYFIIRASFIGLTINNLLLVAKQDSWMSIILAIIIGIIPLYLFIKIMDIRKNMNLIQLNQHIFGRIFGNTINMILIIYIFYIMLISFWNLSNFISSQYLNSTPLYAIIILFSACFMYIVKKGIIILGRVSTMLLYISAFLFAVSLFGLIYQIDFNNLKPMFIAGTSPIIVQSFSYVSFNILPLLMILIIPKNDIEQNDHLAKKLIITYVIANISLFIVLFSTISIFGINLSQLYQYPEFHLLKRVSLIGVIARLESILALQWLFDISVFICFGYYFIQEAVSQILKITDDHKKNYILYIVIIVGGLFTPFVFKNNTEANLFIKNILPIIQGIILFIIPMFIYFVGKKKH